MLKPFKLEKPNLSAVKFESLIDNYSKDRKAYNDKIFEVNEKRYLYWDKIKYVTPPPGLTPEEFWAFIKQVREFSSKRTTIKSEKGNYFSWIRPEYTEEYLHCIDLKVGGQIFTHYPIITTYGKQRLLTKSIVEEAIASSQLEGAVTTTPMAKKLILENKVPKDTSERMIVNNYKTMQLINNEYKNERMSEELLFELHRSITKDTLERSKQGRYRKDEDGISVNDQMKFIYHIPPKEDFIKPETRRLIHYANDEGNDSFLHPIIKAIFLHFWIGYLHPFYDGNGRIARTIFYWYLLKKGYWAIPFLPISLIIKQSPAQYGMSYVYTEQDDLDLTYFYDYHMRKIMEALHNFENYIEKKSKSNKKIKESVKNLNLNERQEELLRYFVEKGLDSYVTPTSYIELYKISRQTASSDLKNLEKRGYIISRKVGRQVRYSGTDKLRSTLVE